MYNEPYNGKEFYVGFPVCIRYDKNKNEISFFTCEQGAGCSYTLKKEGDTIILDGGCGC